MAAMPVVNAQNQVIAVLAASTIDDAHALAGQEAFDDLVVRGQLVARVMVDVLKWFDDDYDATALRRSATTGVRISSGQRRAIVESSRPSAGSKRSR